MWRDYGSPEQRLRVALTALIFWLAEGATGSATDAQCPPAAQPLSLAPQDVARAMRQAPDRGLLWRIERDGHSSWLYGTLHLARPAWTWPGPAVVAALRQSDLLALEVDMTDPSTLHQLIVPPAPEAVERILGPGRTLRLARLQEQACVPPDAPARRLRPVMQAMTLVALSGRADGLYAEFGIDLMLTGFFRGAGKQVVALETAASQLKTFRGDTDADEAARVDDILDALESGTSRAGLLTLAEAWAAADVPKLQSYGQWCDCLRTPQERQRMKRYLDDRNPGLADGVERLHAGGQRVFAAVGVLHMIGPAGLPALLAARGFRITAVVPGR